MSTSTATQPSLRLTRRGRVVLFCTALAMALGVGVAVSSAVVATSEAGDPVATEVVYVQSGQTVWDFARTIHPGGDIRETVDDILRLNALPSAASLQIGQELHLPVYE